MPTYTYECERCKKVYERVQKVTDEPDVVCQECGEPGGVKRVVVAPVGFILNGGGWGKDGY